MVDALMYEVFYEAYDENRDEDDDPDIRENSVLTAKLLNTIITTKHQMSDPCTLHLSFVICSIRID